jgi:hypothetical protein
VKKRERKAELLCMERKESYAIAARKSDEAGERETRNGKLADG